MPGPRKIRPARGVSLNTTTISKKLLVVGLILNSLIQKIYSINCFGVLPNIDMLSIQALAQFIG